jgi:hypothetical protein
VGCLLKPSSFHNRAGHWPSAMPFQQTLT